jgi:hypothetical protein
MYGDEDQETTDVYQLGLSQDEASELQAQLDAEAWQALLAVQHALANAPMLAPSAGFTARVLQSLAVRERDRAWRRNVIGSMGFALGSLVFTAWAVWSSPLSTLMLIGGWTALLDEFTAFITSASTLFSILLAFMQVVLDVTGEWLLFAFAVLALALTLVWTHIVAGPALSNRPEPV